MISDKFNILSPKSFLSHPEQFIVDLQELVCNYRRKLIPLRYKEINTRIHCYFEILF